MNEKNYDYLKDQLKYSGFGETHTDELKDKLQKQSPEFTIFHQQDFGKDNTVSMLYFKKSAESDMYFFNRYELLMKNGEHTDPLKQTFYMKNKEDNITLKESYNMMNGRAVHKELTNKEGQKYTAWVQLDFKVTDKNGNYETKKFHQNYGYDLAQSLARYPIKELSNETDRTKLIESLERGNRQSVTWQHEGKEQKILIEASPQFKSMNMYDSNIKRVNVQSLYEKHGEIQSAKQETKKEVLKQDKSGEDDVEGPRQSLKRARKKSLKIS